MSEVIERDLDGWLERIDRGDTLHLLAGNAELSVWRQEGLYVKRESTSFWARPKSAESREELRETLADWKRGVAIEPRFDPKPSRRQLEAPPDARVFHGQGEGGTWDSRFVELDDGRWLECCVLHNEGAAYGAMFDTFVVEVSSAEDARLQMARYDAR